MENQGYFSQTFANSCNTEPKYEMTEQMLHVRAVDCMNLKLDNDVPNISLDTPIEFNVQFSNGQLNRTNELSLTNIYDKNGNFKKYDTNDTLAGGTHNVQNILGIAPYQQVSKVELKGVSFPFIRNNDYASDPDIDTNTDKEYKSNSGDAFFAIDIPEFAGRVHSTTNKLHDIFAIMYYDSTIPASGAIKPIRGVDFDSKTYIPKAPIKRLNKFKVRFLNSIGDVVKLGDFHNAYIKYTDNSDIADTSSPSLSRSDALKNCIKILYQVSLLFEFTIKL